MHDASKIYRKFTFEFNPYYIIGDFLFLLKSLFIPIVFEANGLNLIRQLILINLTMSMKSPLFFIIFPYKFSDFLNCDKQQQKKFFFKIFSLNHAFSLSYLKMGSILF